MVATIDAPDRGHPDLQGRIRDGVQVSSLDTGRIEPGWHRPTAHGTAVAGLILQEAPGATDGHVGRSGADCGIAENQTLGGDPDEPDLFNSFASSTSNPSFFNACTVDPGTYALVALPQHSDRSPDGYEPRWWTSGTFPTITFTEADKAHLRTEEARAELGLVATTTPAARAASTRAAPLGSDRPGNGPHPAWSSAGWPPSEGQPGRACGSPAADSAALLRRMPPSAAGRSGHASAVCSSAYARAGAGPVDPLTWSVPVWMRMLSAGRSPASQASIVVPAAWPIRCGSIVTEVMAWRW